MVSFDKYHKELEQISFLANIEVFEFKYSNILLFREYQTRLFNWKVELNLDGLDFFNKRKSYHDLFVDLSPSWSSEIVPYETVVTDLAAIGLKHIYCGIKDWQGYFLYLYINWEIFKTTSEIESHSLLKNPYEMIVQMLKRGGIISTSHNMFEINQRTYLKYRNTFKMPSVNNEFLDYIDLKCDNYPNQDMVKKLWIDYDLT